MKKQIRQGVFETNSSQTHSIVIRRDSSGENSFEEYFNDYGEKIYKMLSSNQAFLPITEYDDVKEIILKIAEFHEIDLEELGKSQDKKNWWSTYEKDR